jgi:hypothetical protein
MCDLVCVLLAVLSASGWIATRRAISGAAISSWACRLPLHSPVHHAHLLRDSLETRNLVIDRASGEKNDVCDGDRHRRPPRYRQSRRGTGDVKETLVRVPVRVRDRDNDRDCASDLACKVPGSQSLSGVSVAPHLEILIRAAKGEHVRLNCGWGLGIDSAVIHDIIEFCQETPGSKELVPNK